MEIITRCHQIEFRIDYSLQYVKKKVVNGMRKTRNCHCQKEEKLNETAIKNVFVQNTVGVTQRRVL